MDRAEPIDTREMCKFTVNIYIFQVINLPFQIPAFFCAVAVGTDNVIGFNKVLCKCVHVCTKENVETCEPWAIVIGWGC